MKDITGDIVIDTVEVPTLKNERKKEAFTIKVNAFPVEQLNEHKKMCFVVDGELRSAYLSSYHIGDEEYWVTPITKYNRRPKNIKVYRY